MRPAAKCPPARATLDREKRASRASELKDAPPDARKWKVGPYVQQHGHRRCDRPGLYLSDRQFRGQRDRRSARVGPGWRSASLLAGIKHLLNDPNFDGLARDLYNHGLISPRDAGQAQVEEALKDVK